MFTGKVSQAGKSQALELLNIIHVRLFQWQKIFLWSVLQGVSKHQQLANLPWNKSQWNR